MKSFYNHSINQLNGKPLDLNSFAGKWILVVNTATKCGLTPQLEGLEKLNQQYGNKLAIIGCPSNDFAGQEPLNGNDISEFCQINYGVSFQMTEKIHVKGPNQHPLYKWLTQSRLNYNKSSRVWWNFQKYLINPNGKLVDYFLPITPPTHGKITRYFQK